MCIRDSIIVPTIKNVTGEQQPTQVEGQNQNSFGRPRKSVCQKPPPTTTGRCQQSTSHNCAGKIKTKREFWEPKPWNQSDLVSQVLGPIQKNSQLVLKTLHISVTLSKNIQKNCWRRYTMVTLPIYWCVQALSRFTKWWAQNEEVPVNWHWCAVHPKRIYKDGWRYY